MGFLKRFLKNTFRDGPLPHGVSSFDAVSEHQFEEHLKVARYGSFTLTDAVRPSYDLQVIPEAGFRYDIYSDENTLVEIPVLMASASREMLMDIFMDLMTPLGDIVDVVLETSHERGNGTHEDLCRDHIDRPVLESILWDFEDLLLNDGCTGVAVLNPQLPLELQFDEHKLLIMYGEDVKRFESVLRRYGLKENENLRFISEAEHVHSSSENFLDKFEALRTDLGIDEFS